MAKILWHGDACSNTGFARVTHSILEHLRQFHDVTVVGINYDGDPHDYPFPIFPAGSINCPDRFGIARLPEIVDRVKPDVFICLNDIWVVNNAWERVQHMKHSHNFKFMAYFPIDSMRYHTDMLRNIPHWDLAITFTVPQAQRILDHGIPAQRLGVLPHGVDLSKFGPMPKEEARKNLGIPDDRFIVLNANRNQPRKQIDLTIKAFAKFAADKPDTMLYLHMGTKDMGWEIIPLFEREMKLQGADPTNRLVLTSNDINYTKAPPDELLNTVYNACDVGLNTANGEGWGLVSFEHASCRKPQVVPNHTSCQEIWAGAAMLIDVATWIIDKDLGVERGMVNVDHAASLLTELYENPNTYAEVASACFAVTQRPEYRWESVAKGFAKAVEDLVA